MTALVISALHCTTPEKVAMPEFTARTGLFTVTAPAALIVRFAADVTVTPALNLSGGFAPIIVLAADLDVHVNLVELSGGFAPQITLGGSLSRDLPLTVLEGGLTPIVVLGASSFVSGPLWAASEPCPSPPTFLDFPVYSSMTIATLTSDVAPTAPLTKLASSAEAAIGMLWVAAGFAAVAFRRCHF